MEIVIVEAPELVRDWNGCHVMSTRELRNFYFTFPPKTIFKVRSTGNKKYLEALPCKCCGVSGKIDMKVNKHEFLVDFHFVEISTRVEK